MSKKGDIDYLNCKCPVCGKLFHRKPNRIKRQNACYCSRKCHYEAKRQTMSGESNHQFGLRGELNASWRGGKRISYYGYCAIAKPDHPFATKWGVVLEHRLVAEQYLLTEENSVVINGKRYLSPNYVVHHKNGIKTDNRPENLAVMTLSEHQILHNKITTPKRKRDSFGRFMKESNIKEE